MAEIPADFADGAPDGAFHGAGDVFDLSSTASFRVSFWRPTASLLTLIDPPGRSILEFGAALLDVLRAFARLVLDDLARFLT